MEDGDDITKFLHQNEDGTWELSHHADDDGARFTRSDVSPLWPSARAPFVQPLPLRRRPAPARRRSFTLLARRRAAEDESGARVYVRTFAVSDQYDDEEEEEEEGAPAPARYPPPEDDEDEDGEPDGDEGDFEEEDEGEDEEAPPQHKRKKM